MLNLNSLIRKNVTFFARYYRLIAIATLITTAVIVGSLVVGDSVRTTLVKRVTERLGNTETILFSQNGFMDEALQESSLFGKTSRGILLTNGFISQSGKLIPVFVWGVNDRSIPKGAASVNAALLKELGADSPDAIVLRLPAAGLIPSGSLFVTESYTTSMRLAFGGVIDVENGGNLSMKNEQTIPLNIFVNREELAEVMEVQGKINLILSDQKISAEALNNAWEYTLSGLSVHQKEDFAEIVSDRIFLQDDVIRHILKNNRKTNRLFSYLANTIEANGSAIPYSFVTASDSYEGEPLSDNEIILSDYTAKRLQAKPGDTVLISYFRSENMKTLLTDATTFRVKKIVPLTALSEDQTLSANYPGLSDTERCTDWDSDLPINMDLITDEDEKYWELYRNTPKAIIAYNAIAGKWSNTYGSATAIRVADTTPDLSGLHAEMFGIQRIYPREAGLYAAMHGVDFSGLFLALGFFIIISAMLLMVTPLSEMLYKRKEDVNLFKSIGYTHKRIAKIIWMEAAPVVLVASVIGVVVGLLYTSLIMWLLGNVWKGATHTDGFAVYPDTITIVAGLLAGIILSLGLLFIMITRNLKDSKFKIRDSKKRGSHFQFSIFNSQLSTHALFPILSTLLTAIMIGINFFVIRSIPLFVLAGIVLMGTAALWGHYLIYRKGAVSSRDRFHSKKMIWSTLFANKRQAILSFFVLTIGVFTVFSVGLNRQGFSDSSQLRAGTGSYSIWCESSIPIYHNMETQAGREKLSLTTLPADAEILQCLRHNADDASCLNLNKVSTPTVLGIDMEQLKAADFQIEQSLNGQTRDQVFREMQRAKYIEQSQEPIYPALVDATVLTWGLMMNIGDTLYYENNNGGRVAIQLIGTLSNSIFQGNILIDRKLFSEIWKETAGSEVFLLKVDENLKDETITLLSQALNEYGVRISTTNERLKQFNSVTDTYLTIFMTLGGLGLLLGIMSFIIVIRKNLVMRRKEIALYRTLGFTDSRIKQTLYKENILVPLYAIITGVVCSLVGIGSHFANIGIWIGGMAFVFTILFVLCVVVFVRKSVDKEVCSEL